MDTRIRLTRKPVTTVLWGILAVAMSVFLCVGTALWFSTANLAAVLKLVRPFGTWRKITLS